MVKGIDIFKELFKDNQGQYVIIGGSACDILMENEGLDFRATKDIDVVLIVEALDANFGRKFWKFVKDAGYKHYSKSRNAPEFYRFSKPQSSNYPAVIELFSRKPDIIKLPDEAVVSPMPIGDDVSSLSAIILNDDYYEFLKEGRSIVDDISVLKPEYLIPFKIKAWLDLSDRKDRGEAVDSKDIRKHRNDVFRLTELLTEKTRIACPKEIKKDISKFCDRLKGEEIDPRQLGLIGKSKQDIIGQISNTYLSD